MCYCLRMCRCYSALWVLRRYDAQTYYKQATTQLKADINDVLCHGHVSSFCDSSEKPAHVQTVAPRLSSPPPLLRKTEPGYKAIAD